MKINKTALVLLLLFLAGCHAGEVRDLRTSNRKLQNDLSRMQMEMVQKQERIETAHRILTEIYQNLQKINLSQAYIVEYTGDAQTVRNNSFVGLGENCNRLIGDIDSFYKVNQNMIDSLNQFNDLHLVTISKLVETNNELKRVNEILRVKIVELIGVIETKEAELNRVYFLSASEEYLLNNGIIRHRGLYGFRVHEIAFPINYCLFDSTDKQNFKVYASNKIIDILPHRSPYTYSISNNGHSLTICEDNSFWQIKHLVVVTE